ncbi:MAG: DUF2975 domain-containing protein [Actinomycetota bacterium]|nr:DUF2975 domain-containing protein [Actinomycetota bacterium]MDZ4180041.1 DUF2975 domain-containing protein [Coriobacteriia bacterium]
MFKSAGVLKRFLDVALIVLTVGVIISVFLEPRAAYPEGNATIRVPITFVAEVEELEVQNDVLGTGIINEANGEVIFSAPLTSWPNVLSLIVQALSVAPAFAFLVLLRQMTASIVAGDPFAEANIGRIRAIGWLTVALELFRGAAQFGLSIIMQTTSTMSGYQVLSFGGWNFGVFIIGLALLVLAEVFRHGLQLQSDADLTV